MISNTVQRIQYHFGDVVKVWFCLRSDKVIRHHDGFLFAGALGYLIIRSDVRLDLAFKLRSPVFFLNAQRFYKILVIYRWHMWGNVAFVKSGSAFSHRLSGDDKSNAVGHQPASTSKRLPMSFLMSLCGTVSTSRAFAVTNSGRACVAALVKPSD